MPIYEYRCQVCGDTFEKFLPSMNSRQDFSCPACGSAQIKRAISWFARSGAASGGGGLAAPNCGPVG
jgi:putative FmdB family regulatory protein